MEITFGKYAGKSAEFLLLKEPQYISWLRTQTGTYGAMRQLQKSLNDLMAKFNNMPYQKSCCGNGIKCSKPVIRFTVYLNNIYTPYWWCDECDPYQTGAMPGKLQSICTYHDALTHIELYCNKRTSDYKTIILNMARAKGLPLRVGEKQAQEFFV